MIRIAITAAAFDAIKATLPVGSVAVEAEANQREPVSCAEPSGTNAKWIAEVCG
jgi:hypothetical protein